MENVKEIKPRVCSSRPDMPLYPSTIKIFKGIHPFDSVNDCLSTNTLDIKAWNGVCSFKATFVGVYLNIRANTQFVAQIAR